MSYAILFVFLLLNFGISWFNAWAAGKFWTESKVVGGGTRIIAWCAVVMSACGFTWVYLTLLTMVALYGEYLSPEGAEAMFNLGYLIIIGPVIGSGFGLWIHSLVHAWKRRTFGSIATAGWNSYAQFRNIYEAARHAPSAFESVLSALGGKGRSRKSEGVLIVLLVILAVCGGAMTTAAIVRRADRSHVEDMHGRQA